MWSVDECRKKWQIALKNIFNFFLSFFFQFRVYMIWNQNKLNITAFVFNKEVFASRWLNVAPQHSVESPSMVDPQWNIWYWGSKWNLHTVCWSAVGCEWGTTSVYFGITYVCFNPRRLPVFAVEPQYLLQYFFYFCQKYHLNYTYKIFKKFHVGLKFEWGL